MARAVRRLGLACTLLCACRFEFDPLPGLGGDGSIAGNGDGSINNGDGAGDAAGMTFTLSSAGDTHIIQNSPQNNEGSMAATVGVTASGNPARMLITFDLSTLPPSGTVTSAGLYLQQNSSMGTGDITVDAWRVTSSWGPATVVYATQPTFDTTPVSSSLVTLNTSLESTWTITSTVQAWYAGTAPNFGLLLDAALAPAGSFAQFGTIENGVAAMRPQLRVSIE